MPTQNVSVCVTPELVVNVICQAGPNPELTYVTSIKNLLSVYPVTIFAADSSSITYRTQMMIQNQGNI